MSIGHTLGMVGLITGLIWIVIISPGLIIYTIFLRKKVTLLVKHGESLEKDYNLLLKITSRHED